MKLSGQTSAPWQSSSFAPVYQTNRSQGNCPTVKVSCPTELRPGETLRFTAEYVGGDVAPTYNWTVSAGSISSGQGTPTIEVEVGELLNNQTLTATVDLGGLARGCPTSASCSTTISGTYKPSKVDEYPTVTPDNESSRLNAFSRELLKKPDARAYILVYGGRHSPTGAAQAAADRVKSYLVKKAGIDADRIVTNDGGFREELAIELWVVPPGASLPSAIPTVEPSDVTPRKPAPKQRPRRIKKS